MFDARDCMFWCGAQLGMVALEPGPLGTYAKISAGGDTNIQDEDGKTGHESHVAMRSQDIVIPIVHL